MSDLKGKVAVVTGASKGIGAAIAKGLSAAGAAVVVNYSSSKEGADRVVADINANGGEPTAAIYSGTKGAVDAITRGLAAELGPRKIRVNAIAPGGVETEGTHSAGIVGSDFEKTMIAGTPLGRFGQPDDIARVAVFLASDDSAWLTGERLTASGGYR